MKNIILIGYMGCGKSTIGNAFAKKYNYKYCDTDYLIEKQSQKTINQIFEEDGEEHFRWMETHTLDIIKEQLSKTVLSTGGGMPCKKENVTILKQIGIIVYLKVSKEVLLERLKRDTTRPLLKDKDLDKKIEEMLAIRNPIYENAADYILDITTETIDDVIERIYQISKHIE